MPKRQREAPRERRPQQSDTKQRKRNARDELLASLPKPVRRAVRRGWSIVPQMQDKVSFVPWKEFQTKPPPPAQVARWAAEFPDANWAVVTGLVSAVVVLDFDGEDGELTRKRLELDPMVITPSGGSHVYVKAPPWPIKGGARVDADRFPGMDVRADGQCATFCGRRDEGEYRLTEERAWYAFEDLPSELRELLAEREKKPFPAEFEIPPDFTDFIEPGSLLEEALDKVRAGTPRNECGFWLACQLRDEGQEFEKACAVVQQYSEAVRPLGSHEYGAQEAYNSLVSAFSQPRRAPRSFAKQGRFGDGLMRTDYGNAERLVGRHGEDLRYSHAWRTWLVWNNKCWARDATAEVERRAKETVRSMYAVASKIEDDEARKVWNRWAALSESAGKIHAMVSLAESERRVVVQPDELDADPWLLNCLNGTVNLQNGKLREHRKGDMLTKLCPVEYDEDAESPTWDAFLRRIMPDADDRSFLQRAVGYSLTGHTDEQVMFLLYGLGANGKSTFLEVVRGLLGDYAQQAPSDVLLAKRNPGIPSEIARMQGARFVTAVETDEGRQLAEGLVKQLTGGDRVAARMLYQEWFEFTPVAKLWLATNHKPEVKSNTDAIWRRLRLIPFTVRIPDEERDNSLTAKLKAELPGILQWALAGTRRWRKQGLRTSRNIAQATDSYRSEQDLFGSFLDERCVLGDDLSASAKDLYDAYQGWANSSNIRFKMSSQKFGRTLSERGFQRKKSGKEGARMWRGIALYDGRAGQSDRKAGQRPSRTGQSKGRNEKRGKSAGSGPRVKDWVSA